jgi:hypothetical protein
MEKIAWIGTAQASLKAVVDDFSTLQNELKATEIKNLQSNARTRAVWLVRPQIYLSSPLQPD